MKAIAESVEMKRRIPTGLLLLQASVVLLVVLLAAYSVARGQGLAAPAAKAGGPAAESVAFDQARFDRLRAEGFEALSGLDYDAAQAKFKEMVQAFPDHPAGWQFQAASLWLKTLNQSRRLQSNLYNDDQFYEGEEDKTDPAEVLRAARIVYVSSNTSYFEAVQLQNELRKRADFAAWQMAVVDGWEGRKLADIEIEVDRPLFTYTFTYKLTDRRTGIVLATGKVTGWDGNDAAPKLAKRITEDIKRARQPTPGKRDTSKDASKNLKKDGKDAPAAQVKN